MQRFAVCVALIALATAGCSTGAGPSHIPLETPLSVQSQDAAAAQSALRDVSSHRLATPVPLATGLNDPSAIALRGRYVYIGDTTVLRVHRNGGPVTTVLTGTAIFDSGSNRGVNQLAFFNADIFAGYGGYVSYDVISAPIATGVKTVLAHTTGGFFLGIIGTNVYYGRGFCCIDALPLAGGPATTVAFGVWLRSDAVDATSIYFVEYFSRNLDKFDTTTMTLTTLLSGNAVEGALVIDPTKVYFSQGTTIQSIPKTGGAPVTLYTGTEPHVLATNGVDVFFTDGSSLKAVGVSGGPARTLGSGYRIAVATATKSALYFTDVSHGVGQGIVYRLRLASGEHEREDD